MEGFGILLRGKTARAGLPPYKIPHPVLTTMAWPCDLPKKPGGRPQAGLLPGTPHLRPSFCMEGNGPNVITADKAKESREPHLMDRQVVLAGRSEGILPGRHGVNRAANAAGGAEGRPKALARIAFIVSHLGWRLRAHPLGDHAVQRSRKRQ